VIHGTYDPHPSDGIRLPLEKSIGDFRFILLENCGHEPWTEKHAASRFFEILEREIMNFNLRDGPSQ
jgi:pimeloyl-ACP methyl ester carboxylesterase